ncbi:MAG: hypothetical protein KatS3mg031_0964 [Chitinophagales bacterium]|nr:MAG: hypothetical protein KatS3mg031_0964 [Chitinophagales bacterium]
MHQRLSFPPKAICVGIFLLLGFLKAGAVAYTWNGGVGNWGTAANWTPNGVPGANDKVLITSGTCNLDANVTVSHFEMSGGVFNQNSFTLTVFPSGSTSPAFVAGSEGFKMTGGTFNGSSTADIVIESPPGLTTLFSLSGASLFNSTAKALIVAGDFSVANPANFAHNNGKVIFKGDPRTFKNITGSATFYKLDFRCFDQTRDFYINGSSTILTVLDTLTKTGVGLHNRIYGPGTIYAQGDITMTYVSAPQQPWYGTVNIIINGTGNQRLVGHPNPAQDAWYENIIIDKPSGTLNLIGNIRIGPDLHYRKGIINYGTSTVWFWSLTMDSISGTFSLYNVKFQGEVPFHSRTIAPGDTLTVMNTLEIVGNNLADLYQGTISAKGDIRVTTPNGTTNYCGGNAIISIDGTGNQLLWGQTWKTRGFLPNIVINKPSGTLTLRDTIVVERNWTYIQGNVDALTFNSYVNFTYWPYTPVTAEYYIDGEGPSSTMLFNTIALEQTRKLTGDIRVKNNLILGNNVLFMNGNDIWIENASPAAIQRQPTGYLISETPTPPGSLRWYIHNASPGTVYTFPFAKHVQWFPTTYTYIPFTLTVQTAGVPSGNGWVSCATYPTDPYPPVNNRPLPPGVTNLNNFVGSENAPRELDRFWVYDCGGYSTSPRVSLSFTYLDAEWGSGSNAITENLMRPHQWDPGSQIWLQPPPSAAIDVTNNVGTISNVTLCSAFSFVDPTLPDLIFGGEDTLICATNCVKFRDYNTVKPSSHSWVFPGGTPATSNDSAPHICYNTPGIYDVILTSVYPGGSLTDTLENYITVNPEFIVSVNDTDVLCFGQNTGSIHLNVSGGTGVYAYHWSDGPMTKNRTALAAGTYTVTVSDTLQGGCADTLTINITQPAQLTVSISNVVDPLCSGSCDGRARANPSGGVGPYTYLWNNGETTPDADSLCPGTATVVVTDANGCTASANVNIAGSAPLTVSFTGVVHVSCNGQCTGIATAIPSGGTSPYTYQWCNGQTSATATGLCAGVCSVTVTDAAGCTVTANVSITQPTPLVLNLNKTDVTCYGGSNGAAWVSVTGGTPPYGYQWTNSSTDSFATNLQVGFTAVTVTDQNTCTATATIAVNQPDSLALIITKKDITCNGLTDGTAEVMASGGSGSGYIYVWSAGIPSYGSSMVSGLGPGPVNVTIKDVADSTCFKTASVTISEPPPLNLILSKTDVLCFGDSSGTASVSVTGGTPKANGYSYSWSKGNPDPLDSSKVSNLNAGVVTLTVRDSFSCTASANITINQPSALVLTLGSQNVSCGGAADGKAWVAVSGGTPNYNYLWSNASANDTAFNLSPGSACVTVTDANGCQDTACITITEIPGMVFTTSKTDISCFGANDGKTFVNGLNGGTPPYSKVWTIGGVVVSTTDSATGLGPGQVIFSVTDANNCTVYDTLLIIEPDQLSVLINQKDVSCNGGSDACAWIDISGGTPSYAINWSTGSTLDSLCGLAAGTVSVTVTDANNCTVAGSTTINQPSALSVTVDRQDVSCNSLCDAKAWASVSGGTPGFTYSWSAGNPSALGDSTFNLCAGTVSVTVTDANNCTISANTTVTQPGPLTVTLYKEDISCFGVCDGKAGVHAAGGSGSFSFGTWSANGGITLAGGDSIIQLCAGTASITVTDGNGCTVNGSVNIVEPPQLQASLRGYDITCFGENNGAVAASASGGTPPYIHFWNPAGVGTPVGGDSLTNLPPGQICVAIRDNNGCADTACVNINEPNAIALVMDKIDVTCYGDTDGVAWVIASGGTVAAGGDYTYQWNRGTPLNEDTVRNLAPGPVTVIVRDDNQCADTAFVTIGEPAGMVLTLSKSDLSCSDARDGSAWVAVSGGNPPYSYTWNVSPQNTDSISGLSPGLVSVTVTDNLGCQASDTITISAPPVIAISASVGHVSCPGGNDGSLDVTVVGGTAPYTYQWSNGSNLEDLSALKEGLYTLIVTDQAGCREIGSFNVETATRIELSANVINATCGISNGKIDLTVLQGSGSGYLFQWTGGKNTEDIDSLSPGLYSVTVTDGACSQSLDSIIVENTAGPEMNAIIEDDSTCSSNRGSITLNITNGSGGYTVQWSNGFNTPGITGLSQGTYCVTVSDDTTGCISVACYSVGVSQGIVINGVVSDASCGSTNGTINVTLSQGVAPFTFAWSNGAVTEDITSLTAGVYTLSVSDASGCTAESTFAVNENGPSVTASVTPVSCYGRNDGSITLNVHGAHTFLWSNGAATQNVSNLYAGTYAVTVADSAQCTSVQVFAVSEPMPVRLIADKNDISCKGFNDGSINLTVSGGSGAFTFSWTGPSFSSASQHIDNLFAGDYTVVTTDAKGCNSSLTVSLSEPESLQTTLVFDSVSCGGLADGRAQVSVTGGVPSYSYQWSNGDDTPTADSLAAGYVTITVTDQNNCQVTDSIEVLEPPVLSVALSRVNISCFGETDGQATATASGGNPPYTYQWSNGDNTPTPDSLAAGYVIVTVTDAKSCSVIDSVEIVEPSQLTTSVIADSVDCHGDSSGIAVVTPSGGTPGYTYTWDAGSSSTDSLNTGLFAGVVHVTVTDSRGCVAVDSALVYEPTALSLVLNTTDNLCFGDSNGTARVTAVGGTPPFTYTWSSGTPAGNGDTVTNLQNGFVRVTVTDWHQCMAVDSAEINSPGPIALTLSKTDISCYGAHDGKASVVVTGGTPGTAVPYTYLWSEGTPPLDRDSTTGLGPGLVWVVVTDSLNCSASDTVVINEPAVITLTMDSTNITCFGDSNGTAQVTVSGGTPPFTYTWSSGTPQLPDSSSVIDLAPGIIIVTVRDSNGCTFQDSVNIYEPPVLTLSISHTDVACFGDSTGTATVSPSGGTPLYSYSWSAGTPLSGSPTVTKLPAGAVSATVTDANGCIASISDTIRQPATAISTVLTKTDVSCFGGSDGTAKVVASGGVPAAGGPAGYTYSWSAGTAVAPGDSVHSLPAGVVSVLVTDSNGCVHADSIEILQPALLTVTVRVDSNANCNGGTNGGLTVHVQGGTPNYSYTITAAPPLTNTPDTSYSVSGLGVGSYTAVVTDSKGCSSQATTSIGERPGPQIGPNDIVITRPTCNRADGAILILHTTADPPNQIQWSPSSPSPASGFNPTNLLEGLYTATITDASTCDTVLTIQLTDIAGPAVDFVKIKDSYCDDNDGRATAIITGGTPAYSFEWINGNGVSFATDSVITGLVPDLYSLIVRDANACDTQINFSIINVASPNAVILPQSPQTIYEGQVIDLQASSDIATVRYTWAPPDYLSCADCNAPSASPVKTISYQLIVTDTTTQCADTVFMTIIVKDETNIFIPNVITPNGDGINDVWRITELQEVFPDNEVIIVNRWGDEVFRKKGYQNDWDGTYRNKKLPDGTYYYVIKLHNIGKAVTGHVTILSN